MRFGPGARTAWHSHSLGQTLHCHRRHRHRRHPREGHHHAARRHVHTPPGEEHWHGALPNHFMAHLAMWEDDDATWGEHVTDQEYTAAAVEERS